jgi:hypothetical protein
MRAWEESSRRPRVPIVAVTANAFAEDVEKSRQAGCDGHLTKPIRKPVLFEALRRWCGPNAAPGWRDAPGAVTPAAGGAHASGVPGDGAPSGGRVSVTVPPEVAPYIPGYLDVTREQLTAGVMALDGGDCLPLRTLGHNLKGSGSSFGLEEISRIGWRLEQSAARGDAVQARAAARALLAYLDRLDVL